MSLSFLRQEQYLILQSDCCLTVGNRTSQMSVPAGVGANLPACTDWQPAKPEFDESFRPVAEASCTVNGVYKCPVLSPIAGNFYQAHTGITFLQTKSQLHSFRHFGPSLISYQGMATAFLHVRISYYSCCPFKADVKWSPVIDADTLKEASASFPQLSEIPEDLLEWCVRNDSSLKECSCVRCGSGESGEA